MKDEEIKKIKRFRNQGKKRIKTGLILNELVKKIKLTLQNKN